jgi:hypothetical protein
MKRQVCALIISVALASGLGGIDASAQSPTVVAGSTPASTNAAPIQNTKGFAENTGLFRATSVVGSAVKDVSGKDAGKIEDLLLDHRGHVGYAVVSFGGFLGIGDKLFAVPWDAVVMESSSRTVYIDVKKETLARSPSFASDKWPDASNRDWAQDVKKSWSDASITAAVKTKLVGASAATLVKVHVDTTNGIVQLNGSVDTDKTRQRATELTQQVDGVRRVVNNLKVQG